MGKSETSVAEALGRAHVALMEDLRKLEGAARSATGGSLEALRACLLATRAHITEHFRFEEHNGYMDVVRTREPRLERAVQHLAEEHQQLSASLEALLARVSSEVRMGDTIGDDVRAWVGQVRQHEGRENDVLQTAFNLDISGED